jgi:uroporphyrinogen-III decarboxylase
MSMSIYNGVSALVPREKMMVSAAKLCDTYQCLPDAPFYHKTFGLWMCEETWYQNGLPRDTDLHEFFSFDEPGYHELGQLGWCEAAFAPVFEETFLEDRGEHELVQDCAGRAVLYFKGRRQGFMPEYLGHPVKDRETWERDVKWRLNPDAPQRYQDLDARMQAAKTAAARGLMIQQNLIGGYMYLRSLMGPAEIMYALYDMPEVVHDCMQTWLALADTVTARHQQYVTLDELFLAEDICYNHGPLISPDAIKQFLFPYYQQLIENVKTRQLDPTRKLYIQLDTDGNCLPVIDLYREGIGMDMLDPFEVASGCDVVQIGRDYPDLIMSGGIDKRVLAQDRNTIDRYLEGILPVMRKRGGYIPTCDHGVPPEVPWENYQHYRQRCVEYGS